MGMLPGFPPPGMFPFWGPFPGAPPPGAPPANGPAADTPQGNGEAPQAAGEKQRLRRLVRSVCFVRWRLAGLQRDQGLVGVFFRTLNVRKPAVR